MNRRNFIRHSGLSMSSLMLLSTITSWKTSIPTERKFTLWLDTGALGIKTDQKGILQYASDYGFEAISAFPNELAQMSESELAAFKDEMQNNHIVWGSAGLPVQFRQDEATFREGLSAFPDQVAALARAGVSRMNTWIMPNHDTLTYRQNYHQHANRLKIIANILGDQGIRLGLEYVGPKTLWTDKRYAFIHTMAETKELIEAIGESNVGFVLDSFHWFTAGEEKADILTLTDDDVVACDLNDARSGYSKDEQIDGKRELPGEGSVIDLQAFVDALVAVGYTGPVRAEPFNQAVRDMEPAAALQKTYDTMIRTFQLVD